MEATGWRSMLLPQCLLPSEDWRHQTAAHLVLDEVHHLAVPRYYLNILVLDCYVALDASQIEQMWAIPSYFEKEEFLRSVCVAARRFLISRLKTCHGRASRWASQTSREIYGRPPPRQQLQSPLGFARLQRVEGEAYNCRRSESRWRGDIAEKRRRRKTKGDGKEGEEEEEEI